MMDKKREVFIQLNKINEIIALVEQIRKQQKEVKSLFTLHDKLSIEENKLFESWNYSFEEVTQKLDHVIL